MLVFCKYVIYFMLYSFLGWLMEVIVTLIEDKKLVNRGFLIGPVCPIYGFGVLGIVFLIGRNTTDLLSVFLKSIFLCSILEYYTSYFMEKIFKARWWDYSKRKYNLNGRICLETMIPFGILGVLVLCYVQPFLVNLVSTFSNNLIFILAIICVILFLVDNIVSFNVLSKIKDEIVNQKVDNTEDIRKRVKKWLLSNTCLFKRIFEAFPRFKIRRK